MGSIPVSNLPSGLGTAATKNVGAMGGVAPNDLSDLLGTIRPLGEQVLLQTAIPFIVNGTEDGNPTVDEQPAIQAAWDKATAINRPLKLMRAPNVTSIRHVRINECLRASKSGAYLETDGGIHLHSYATDFPSIAYDITEDSIRNGMMIYFGPPAGSPISARIENVGADRITCVFHPPVDAQGNRVPSLIVTYPLYFDRCDRPRARQIDVSGLNAGSGLAYTSCRWVDFDVTTHDCAMVVDPVSTDPAHRNSQLSGVTVDDLWAGRGIDPTIGGTVRATVYGLTSNRALKQTDGVNDQGSRRVTYYISARGVDEALDTFGTGSTYYVDSIDCTTHVKITHGGHDNVVHARGLGGSSPVNGGRAAVLVAAGNREDTARNRVTLDLSGYVGTRLVELGGDTNGFTASGAPILTKNVGNVVNLTARSCQTARLMSETGTGLGNTVNVEIDPASVSATSAASEAEFLQASANPATRLTVKRGQNTRPTAVNAASARLQGANYATGFYDQVNGNLVPLASGDELDRVHGITGTGLLRRKGAGDYDFLTYAEGTWTPALAFATPGSGPVYATQSGSYVKVGKNVTAQARLTLSSKGSGGAGAAVLSGLPFAAALPTPIGIPRYTSVALPAGAILSGFANGSLIGVQYITNAGWDDATFDNIGANLDIILNFSYIAAA